jgi:hypothetical protein
MTYGAAFAMPNFLRNILIGITGYGWIVLLVGLGILGYAGYTKFKASSGTAYAAVEQLSNVSGKVVKASEVTVTSKGRRGRSRTSDRYFEIEVKPDAGDAQTLRINLSVGAKKVEAILDEKIAAKFDPEDNNLVYEVKMGSKDVLSYEDTKAYMQKAADSQARAMGDAVTLGLGALLLVLGAGGMFFNRKLSAQAVA